MSSTSNDRTLEAYEANVQAYIDGTPKTVDGQFKTWIDQVLTKLPPDARILELGSAFGRDADYIETKDFIVDRTDATKKFVELQRSHGHQSRALNAITDDLGVGYDMIFANAVLLHFTEDEVRSVFAKVLKSLKPNGIFAFSVKEGEGEEWSSAKLDAPRYFRYWKAKELEETITASGLQIEQIDEVKSDSRNVRWIHVIARSKS